MNISGTVTTTFGVDCVVETVFVVLFIGICCMDSFGSWWFIVVVVVVEVCCGQTPRTCPYYRIDTEAT